MTVLRASSHIENGSIQLRLNNQVIAAAGVLYEAELVKGEYVLQWFAEGTPNASFGITVSSPASAEFQLFRKLDSSGKDFGGYRFLV